MVKKKFYNAPVTLGATLKKELDELLEHGWIHVHAYMSQLDYNDASMDILLYMIRREVNGRNRDYILHRVYRCYKKMQLLNEERELYGA